MPFVATVTDSLLYKEKSDSLVQCVHGLLIHLYNNTLLYTEQGVLDDCSCEEGEGCHKRTGDKTPRPPENCLATFEWKWKIDHEWCVTKTKIMKETMEKTLEFVKTVPENKEGVEKVTTLLSELILNEGNTYFVSDSPNLRRDEWTFKIEFEPKSVPSFTPELNKTYTLYDIAKNLWLQNKNLFIKATAGDNDGAETSFEISEESETLIHWKEEIKNLIEKEQISKDFDIEFDLEDKSVKFYTTTSHGNQWWYLFGIGAEIHLMLMFSPYH